MELIQPQVITYIQVYLQKWLPSWIVFWFMIYYDNLILIPSLVSGRINLGLQCTDGQFLVVTDKVHKNHLENFSWSVIHFQSLFTVEDASCSRKQEPRLTRVSEECSKVGADGRTDGIINDLDNITQEKLLKSISF